MTTIIFGLLIGFALLIWSADRFVIGAVGLARILNISPLVIGVVIIGFGTSAPELLISGVSAWQGNSGLALGNAVGSNITNIALILGVTALLTPILVARQTLLREFPLLFASMGLAWYLLRDSVLSLGDASILLVTLIIVIGYLATTSENIEPQVEDNDHQRDSIAKSLFWTVSGLILLLISSNILVTSSVKLAHLFGISDLVIGLTIVAIGTSLPELAASVTGAIKHHTDLAIGNVLGSNIFNTLGVISVPGFIGAYTIPGEALTRDFPIMFGVTLFLLLLAYLTHKGKGMYRLSGLLFLTGFIGYQVTLYIQSVQS
tara:strand:- start:20147 stop:21100 length:954 start_codon:yes stop_codon:yes gene_type:complete